MTQDPDLIVRIGTPADIDDMMELAILASKENAFTGFSKTRILYTLYPLLERKGGLVGVVGPREGKPQGGVMLRIGPPWYSDNDMIEELGVFIHPEYRTAKGGRATLLYKFCKQVADKLEMPLLIGVLSNHRTAGKKRYYERYFGEEAGAYYLYKANTGGAVEGRSTDR